MPHLRPLTCKVTIHMHPLIQCFTAYQLKKCCSVNNSIRVERINCNFTNRNHGKLSNECISAHFIPTHVYFYGLSNTIIITTIIILFPKP